MFADLQIVYFPSLAKFKIKIQSKQYPGDSAMVHNVVL